MRKRQIITVGILAILAVTTLALWIATYFTHQINLRPYQVKDGRVHYVVIGSQLHISREIWRRGSEPHTWSTISVPGVCRFSHGITDGGALNTNGYRAAHRHWSFRLYLWVPFVLFATYPSWLMMRWVHKRARPRPGECSKCLYDLTGNVSGICPECGTPV